MATTKPVKPAPKKQTPAQKAKAAKDAQAKLTQTGQTYNIDTSTAEGQQRAATIQNSLGLLGDDISGKSIKAISGLNAALLPPGSLKQLEAVNQIQQDPALADALKTSQDYYNKLLGQGGFDKVTADSIKGYDFNPLVGQTQDFYNKAQSIKDPTIENAIAGLEGIAKGYTPQELATIKSNAATALGRQTADAQREATRTASFNNLRGGAANALQQRAQGQAVEGQRALEEAILLDQIQRKQSALEASGTLGASYLQTKQGAANQGIQALTAATAAAGSSSDTVAAANQRAALEAGVANQKGQIDYNTLLGSMLGTNLGAAGTLQSNAIQAAIANQAANQKQAEYNADVSNAEKLVPINSLNTAMGYGLQQGNIKAQLEAADIDAKAKVDAAKASRPSGGGGGGGPTIVINPTTTPSPAPTTAAATAAKRLAINNRSGLGKRKTLASGAGSVGI